MILIIDNYDSFTYNLYQLIGEILVKERLFGINSESEVPQFLKVYKNDEIEINDIKKLKPTKIIISPGPGRPPEAGISKKVIEEFYQEIPILGVCLGHQAIGEVFGAKVIQAPEILHGKTSKIQHRNSSIFKNLPNSFEVARYHSLVIDRVPEDFELLAWLEDKSEFDHNSRIVIMGIKHFNYPLYGVQFHPESFMTKGGEILMKNFLI